MAPSTGLPRETRFLTDFGHRRCLKIALYFGSFIRNKTIRRLASVRIVGGFSIDGFRPPPMLEDSSLFRKVHLVVRQSTDWRRLVSSVDLVSADYRRGRTVDAAICSESSPKRNRTTEAVMRRTEVLVTCISVAMVYSK